ncbi:MAG TPA: tripartite tricarboxylate transporter TctB family protein [Actinomycetes bacterium]|nr:tripartite tricarboxylate transporter TctB family protein [Actinomycetes bacterium]
MSKERARRRAEERARKNAPHSKSHDDTPHQARPAPGQRTSQKRHQQRSARAERQRRRLIAIAACWVLANALIFMLTSTWNAKWLGLTLTTIAVPLIVWLVWDPEGRTNL